MLSSFTKYLEKHSLVAALSDMVPVRARRQINYPADVLGENMPSERVLKEQEQYALNHINRKLVLEPKVSKSVSSLHNLSCLPLCLSFHSDSFASSCETDHECQAMRPVWKIVLLLGISHHLLCWPFTSSEGLLKPGASYDANNSVSRI